MTDEDLRDCFAMFALAGLVMMNKEPYDDTAVAELSWRLADKMLETRKKEKEDEEDTGIAAVVPKRSRRKR